MAKSDRICLRIAPALRKRLEREARAQERSLSWLIEFYVKAGLGLAEPPQPTTVLKREEVPV